jgi:hypothetical protein
MLEVYRRTGQMHLLRSMHPHMLRALMPRLTPAELEALTADVIEAEEIDDATEDRRNPASSPSSTGRARAVPSGA